jgi:hypothetical protein
MGLRALVCPQSGQGGQAIPGIHVPRRTCPNDTAVIRKYPEEAGYRCPGAVPDGRNDAPT